MAEALGLITLQCSLDTLTPMPKTIVSNKDLQHLYSDKFDWIGNHPDRAKLYVKDRAAPLIDPPRKYSIHMKPKLKVELDRMESQGVIAMVEKHSDCYSSLITTIKKDGSVRVCLDLRKLNENLRRDDIACF